MNRLELLNEFANSASYHILRWFSGSSELILTKSSSLDPKKASIKMQFQTYSLFSPLFFFFFFFFERCASWKIADKFYES